MEREDQKARRSSLPSSLIPYLYRPPQHPRDTVSNPSATNYSISPAVREEDTVSTNESPPAQATIPLVPLASTSPTTTPSLSFTGGRNSPRFYSPYLPIDPEAPSQSSFMAGPGDGRISRVRRTIDVPNIPSTGQRYSSPIYSDPVFHTSRPTPFRQGQGYTPLSGGQTSRPTWREWKEGEAGPSSLTLPGSFSHLSMGPDQVNQQPEGFNRPTWPEGHSEVYSRGSPQAESSRHSLRPVVTVPAHRLYNRQSSRPIQELPPPHALFPGSEAPSSVIYGRRHEASPTLQSLTTASVGQRSWASENSTHGTSLLPALTPIRAEPTSPERRNIEKAESEDSVKPVQRRKRRRDPAETDNRTGKAGSPRKTAVACNFCRGRKLRCNGARPACHNCTVRKIECEYVPMQRRRGPGKANKGSKSKKTQQGGPSSGEGPTDSPPSRNDQELGDPAFGLDASTPRQPYTSVMSLEEFTFQPPGSSSGYSGASVEPQRPGSQDGCS